MSGPIDKETARLLKHPDYGWLRDLKRAFDRAEEKYLKEKLITETKITKHEKETLNSIFAPGKRQPDHGSNHRKRKRKNATAGRNQQRGKQAA